MFYIQEEIQKLHVKVLISKSYNAPYVVNPLTVAYKCIAS